MEYKTTVVLSLLAISTIMWIIVIILKGFDKTSNNAVKGITTLFYICYLIAVFYFIRNYKSNECLLVLIVMALASVILITILILDFHNIKPLDHDTRNYFEAQFNMCILLQIVFSFICYIF